MHCSKCGRDVAADAAFCSHCGTRVASGSETGANDTSPVLFAAPKSGSTETEATLWEGGYSAKAMVGSWLAGGLASILLIVGCVLFPVATPVLLGLFVLLWLVLASVFAYRRLSIYYQLTSQRFIHQAGILSRSSDRIEMIDIDDVAFTQSIVERLFDVGTIKLSSSDRTHPVFQLIGVAGVRRVANLIDDARRQERRKHSVHIENV